MPRRANGSDRRSNLPIIYGMNARWIPPPFIACLLLALSGLSLSLGAQEENPPLPGDFPAGAFPDNWEARSSRKQDLILASRSSALSWKDKIYRKGSSDARVSVVAQKENFYILFENKRGGKYSTYAQGSWVVKRSRSDGEFVQAKIFLKSDPGVFARIFPFKDPTDRNDRCKMEIILYGAVAYQDILLPVGFEEILSQPFSKIMEYSSAWVDWDFLSPDLELYREESAMVAAIRSGLKNLSYRDDGAISADGQPVFIESGKGQDDKPGLNCSGFAKWVVDGLYARLISERAAQGEEPAPLRMPIEELKQPHYELRGTSFSKAFEDIRDTYFGLDWVRNLGRLLSDALYPNRQAGPGDLDVTIHPASQVTGTGEILNTRLPYDPYPDFAPNMGYLVSGLKPLLYTLAIQDPGSFYLGAFSSDEGNREPSLTQYSHIAVFFPRFDENGIFRVNVFESCAETSLESVMRKKADEKFKRFVFLVRLPSSSRVDYEAASGELIKKAE
jgi:hypothetical protein